MVFHLPKFKARSRDMFFPRTFNIFLINSCRYSFEEWLELNISKWFEIRLDLDILNQVARKEID